MHSKESIIERLKDLIIEASITPIDKESINENTKLIDNLGFDSISIINLVIKIEESFGIQIDDETLSLNIINLFNNLVECIINKINKM